MKALNRNIVAGTIIMCSLATVSFTPISSFANSTQSPSIVINGRSIYSEATPYIKEGTTMVPLRIISEKLGASVDWDSSSQSITIAKEVNGISHEINLTIGKVVAKANGETKTLTYAPEMINGVTYVPLRFISETLNCTVGYDVNTKKVTVNDKDYKPVDKDNLTANVIVQDGEDMFGRKVRTTNLPSNASDFPYIAEGIPNWAYECQAKSWINNYWGPRYFVPASGDDGKSNVKGIKPIELFNEISNENGNKNLATAIYKYYDGLDEYVNAVTNVDYRTLDEETWVNAVAGNTSSAGWSGNIRAGLSDMAQQYFKKLMNCEIITTCDYQIMPEAAWTGYNLQVPHIYVPIYMKFTVDHNTSSSGNYAPFGLTQLGISTSDNEYMRVGKTYEGVVTLVLTQDEADNNEFRVLYHYSGITSQIRPGDNLLDAVAPELKDDNAPTVFDYTWLVKGAQPYDKYSRPVDCDLTRWLRTGKID